VPTKGPVVISHFGLKIARIAIADNIYLTILKKGENAPDNIKYRWLNFLLVVILKKSFFSNIQM
jgi:hypothetical protein